MNKNRLLLLFGNEIKIPWFVTFDGSASIDGGSDATIDDLHAGEFTVDGYLKIGVGNADFTNPITKGTPNTGNAGWGVIWYTDVFSFEVTGATAVGRARTAYLDDGEWHHVTLYYNDAGDRKPYIAIDGVWVASYALQSVVEGAVLTDATLSLSIGCHNNASGHMTNASYGWMRISNNDRYSHGTNFSPRARNAPPSIDVNTLRLFKVDEGTGQTITDSSTNAKNGTMTNGVWEK